MSIGVRHPWQAVDYQELARLYPPPSEYFESRWYDEPEEIDRLKLARLKSRALHAERIPFHQRRWQEAGFDPRGIATLDDALAAPVFDVEDIRESIEKYPPMGDYQAVGLADVVREPIRIHMSGGTTGAPRPTFYTAWDREVGGVLTARGVYLQGIRPGDVVLNSWSYGLHNGAFIFDEALHRWLNCVIVTTGTGNVTSTRKQVTLARDYRAAAILTTGDYLLRIAEEARLMGLDPARDLFLKSLATNVGSEDQLEEVFGLRSFATYGIHELQFVSAECEAHDGLHIFEDAYHIQVVDPDTGEELPDGELGSMVVTEMYKTGSAQYRFDTRDLAYLYPRERCACGSWTRRMSKFAGRADNMVKLRGINVWPEGVGKIAASVSGLTSDYFVTLQRDGSRDTLTIAVVSEAPRDAWPTVKENAEQLLNDSFGIAIGVDVVAPGDLDELTEIHTSPKPKRFKDLR